MFVTHNLFGTMEERLFDRAVSIIRTGFLGSKSQYEVDLDKSMNFLKSIKEPKDSFERSFAQYKCQCFLRNTIANALLNVGSFFLIVPYVIVCLIKSVQYKEKKDIVYTISILDKTIIPDSLRSDYPSEYITGEYDGICLTKYDLSFIYGLIKRYPFSCFLIFKAIIKISIYRCFIEEYRPHAIAINSEFSCVSSIMTRYCEQQGIRHINIMHGEKLLYIRDSFFEFSKCYIWDEFYKKLFTELRAKGGQFVIERPQSVIFDVKRYRDNFKIIDYKYYLFENSQVKQIAHVMHLLKSKGYTIKVRPHPAYSDMNVIKKYFNDNEIEDIAISIEESVSNTYNAISLVSTVLTQAYYSGVNVIIDDMNYREKYMRLKDLKYILLDKQLTVLSDLI